MFICGWKKFLQDDRLSLGHHKNLFLNAVSTSGPKQALRWFIERLETERKRAVMHWDQRLRTELEKRFDRFLRIHVNFAAGHRIVSANGKQCDLDVKAVADFLEPGKVSAVAAVKNRAAIRRDDEPAKVTMQIREEPGAPVMAGRERNLQRPEFDRLPIIQLVHNLEAEIVYQISHAHRHDDWLIRRNAPQRAPVEMIEVSVSHQDKINRRQMVNFKAWLLQTFDHLEPLRPDRVDQDVDLVSLNEKRRVADPCDADLAFADFRELRSRRTTRTFDEERRNQHAGKKIALVPVSSRTQPDARGTFYRRAIPRRLTNNVSSASFCKGNRHNT